VTIGIAAAGAGAAAAIVAALHSAETIASGAIGGFVSLAAIAGDRLHHAEAQAGGTQALFPAGTPDWVAQASCAVLMSSGPHRPAPLLQFTPGDAVVGLVTGHRFPNMAGRDGHPINLTALQHMRDGLSPQAAVDEVAGANPEADAGLLAITPDGRIGLKDCDYLEQFADRGHAMLTGAGGAVAVTHNGIAPYRGLAMTLAEIALSRMTPPAASLRRIEIRAGIPLRDGPHNAVEIDDQNRVVALWVRNPALTRGTNSFGLGYRADVIGGQGAQLQYEPYMVSEDGILSSIDGSDSAWLTIA